MSKLVSPFKVAFLLSYICVASVAAALLTPALPAMAIAFHISQAHVALVVSLFLIGYVTGQLVYGPLAHRIGLVASLRVGLGIALIGMGICLWGAYYVHYELFLAGRLLSALGAASGLPCTFMLLHSNLTPQQNKSAMAYAVVAFTFAIGIAVLIGGIVTQYFSWQDCLWVLLIYISVMLVATLAIKTRVTKSEPMSMGCIFSKLGRAFKNKSLCVFSLVVGICSSFGYLYAACAPLIASHLLHLSPSAYGYWNCLNLFGMAASGYAGAQLMKRMPIFKLVMIGITGCLLCIVLFIVYILTLTHSTLLFFSLTTGLYLFAGLLFPAGSYLALHAIEDKQSGSSAMSFINMGSATLAVLCVSFLSFNTLHSFILIFALFVLVVIALLLWHQAGRKI